MTSYAVSNPGQVFAGDRELYAFYAGNSQYVDDGTHPTQIGADMFALFWAKAFVKNVLSLTPDTNVPALAIPSAQDHSNPSEDN